MARVKLQVQRVILEGHKLVGEARAAVAGMQACMGGFLGFGRDVAACTSMASRIDQVERELQKLETRRVALDESSKGAVDEAKKLVNLAKLYVDELAWTVRQKHNESQQKLPLTFDLRAVSFANVVREVLATLAGFAVDVVKGAGEGLAEGLGFGGVLLIAVIAYAWTNGARA